MVKDRQRSRQRGTQEMKESDYAEGTGDAGTKLSVHCLSTHLYNAFMQPMFSLTANFKSFICTGTVIRRL